jgi:hypothetical protein
VLDIDDEEAGRAPASALALWLDNHADAPAAPAAFGDEAAPQRTTADGIPLAQILHDRPDVFAAYYTEFYGPNNDHHSSAWVDRVGGTTVEDYANYWYETYGKYESIDPARILVDRPDVFRDFYVQYYGPNNDRHSSAWMNRVGGDTPEAYALYWYKTYGVREGYSQAPAGPSAPDTPDEGRPDSPAQPEAPAHDPADDPWNHRALFPDWTPPDEGWEPPADIWHGPSASADASASLFDGSGVG